MRSRRSDIDSTTKGTALRANRPIVLLTVAVVLAGLIVGGCGGALNQAKEFESSGDWEGALAAYHRVLADKPNDLAALSGAAVALMVLERFREALDYQERVIAADPRDAQTRVELGFNYLNHQGRPADAVRVLSEAVELEPTAKFITFLGQAQMVAGDLRGAEQSLRRAVEVDPEYGYAYSVLAGLLADEGRGDEATQLKEDARSRGVKVIDL
jgi:tetratricopeptide (TPR) repeat protein